MPGGESLDGHRQSKLGERKDEGHGLTPGQFRLFPLSSWPLFSGSLQRTDHAGKATDVHLAPGAQKELKLLSHFFATCCKFKATRDKAFCMREWKEKRPLVILLADSQKHNSAGGRGEGNRSRRRGGSL